MGNAAHEYGIGIDSSSVEQSAASPITEALPEGRLTSPHPEIDSKIPISEQSYATRLKAAGSDIALIKTILDQAATAGAHTPISVLDLDLVARQVSLWNREMAGVTPHYAVKCNDTPALLKLLDSLGVSFDAATAGELMLLKSLGISSEKVICTHPSRREEDIDAIAECRPRAVVVDSPEEMRKLRRVFSPDYTPEIYIRISLSKAGLSGAFGVPVLFETEGQDGQPHEAVDVTGVRRIVAEIQSIERELSEQYEKPLTFRSINISTHVGTNTCTTEPYEKVFKTVPIICEALKSERIITLESGKQITQSPVTIGTLDLGGGYCDTLEPVKHGTTQEQFFAALGQKVREFQQAHPELLLIAEPGRAMVASAGTLAMSVTSVLREYRDEVIDGKRVRSPDFRVRLDDGIYASLMGQIHDGQMFQFAACAPDGTPRSTKTVPFTLKGATCDSFDTIEWRRALPEDLQPGDILIVRYAGAYTAATATKFNSINPPQKAVVHRTELGIHTEVWDWSGELIGEFEGPLHKEELSLEGLSVEEMAHTLSRHFGASPECARSIAGLLSGPLNTAAAPEEAQRLYNKKLLRALTAAFNNETTHQLRDLKGVAVGGMGIVLEGTDSLGRTVALKVALDEADSELAKRFKGEAKLTAELAAKDKRIPAIIHAGVFPEGGLAFYTMELIKGTTLSKTIEALHSLSGGEIDWKANPGAKKLLGSISEAALALQVAHEQKIFHRDVKPENLMVPEGIKVPIKVIDWGLFKGGVSETALSESLDQPGLTEAGLGTIDYMSPEQARGEEVSAATDVWALGATLYKAVFNEVPLESWGSAIGRFEALRRAPEDLIKVPEGAPQELRSIILKAMSLNSKDRYESATDFAEDLRAFLERKPVAAHQEQMNPVEKIFNSTMLLVEREKTKVIATAAGITLTVGGLFTWNKIENERQKEHEAALIAKSDLESLRKSAEKAFSDAKELSNKNRLEEARAQLSDNLIRDLARHPELRELHSEAVRYREAWDTLSRFEAEIFKVYSGLVNSFEFGSIKTIDVDAMREASKIYLPDGLTEDGVTKLRARLDSLPLTKEQRLKIGDGLIEWACLQAGEDFPDVLKFGYIDEESKAQCADVFDRIALIEGIATACEGSEEGAVHGWMPATEYLKRKVFAVLEDKAGMSGTLTQGALPLNPRGSGFFLIGLFGRYVIDDKAITLFSGLSNFPAALAASPNHLAANILLTDTLYEQLSYAKDDRDRRNQLKFLLEKLEDCCRIDPENIFLHGRLALMAQFTWSRELVVDRNDRISRVAYLSGIEAGVRATELSTKLSFNLPPKILAAYGELLFFAERDNSAIEILRQVVSADMTDFRSRIFLACAEAGQGQEFGEGQVISAIEQADADPEIRAFLSPQIAAIYSSLSEREFNAGNIRESESYKSEALSRIQEGILKIPAYRDTFRRKAVKLYSQLQNDSVFQELIR